MLMMCFTYSSMEAFVSVPYGQESAGPVSIISTVIFHAFLWYDKYFLTVCNSLPLWFHGLSMDLQEKAWGERETGDLEKCDFCGKIE